MPEHHAMSARDAALLVALIAEALDRVVGVFSQGERTDAEVAAIDHLVECIDAIGRAQHQVFRREM